MESIHRGFQNAPELQNAVIFAYDNGSLERYKSAILNATRCYLNATDSGQSMHEKTKSKSSSSGAGRSVRWSDKDKGKGKAAAYQGGYRGYQASTAKSTDPPKSKLALPPADSPKSPRPTIKVKPRKRRNQSHHPRRKR
ncbi:hypothetical protein TWF481_002871 [Arthrobotrys musiformis]|uniref:Uncharacterized protein n=1 Tax=Arthrobotrys musiformis TaxID=47236 RepID=A0AAV9VRL7_9PEZI